MESLEERGIQVTPLAHRHLFSLDALGDKPDVVHFQSITPYLLPAARADSTLLAVIKGALFLAQVALLRLAGCRIVWTVHNLVNHELRLAAVEQKFSAWFARLAHVLIAHSQTARSVIVSTFGLQRRADSVAVVLHPNYIGAYPNEISRDEARHELGIDRSATAFLALGQIRPYKGLVELVETFRSLPHTGVELWIAGQATDQDLSQRLRRESEPRANIHIHAGHVPPEKVQIFLNACDAVVLPYRSILTSGAALLAMSFGRPCIAPRLGCLVEVLDERGAFMYDPDQADGLQNALTEAIESSAKLPAMGHHNLERASQWSWSRAAERLLELYRGSPSPSTRPGAPPEVDR
jgi:glycosyltransferase involved in cell wall biosynthesis